MNISEIAKMAGVSSSAVSRYLNHGYVSEEKKAAIQKVIEETGYRPSAQAQMLRTKKTKLIGVIMPKINSASLGSVVAGIHSVLEENGYKMLLADTRNNPQKELEYLSVFDEKQVDGVLLIATVLTAEHRKMFKKMRVPVVLIGQHMPGMRCVYHDDYHASLELTRLILSKGRRNIGFVSATHQDTAAGLDRYRGFCDAVKEAGLEHLAEKYVVSDFNIQAGYEAAAELFYRYQDLDALICATDTIASGVMKYMKERNIKIPEDIMTAGFGDSELSKVVSPTLTTMHFSYMESGTLAAQMMVNCLSGEQEAVKGIVMDYYLVENESSR